MNKLEAEDSPMDEDNDMSNEDAVFRTDQDVTLPKSKFYKF
jgi:hypothetical protein